MRQYGYHNGDRFLIRQRKLYTLLSYRQVSYLLVSYLLVSYLMVSYQTLTYKPTPHPAHRWSDGLASMVFCSEIGEYKRIPKRTTRG